MIKNNLFQFIIILIPILSQCQVGINTTTPTEALDVNGKLRVRSISASPSNNAIKDSVLVFEDDGILKYTSAKKLLNKQVVESLLLKSPQVFQVMELHQIH